ncbi:MAG TPA: class I SAM-dependent methyltransferase [Flavobacteriaceae bacterium]|nr:class I SAM-dependent methyltransferase [Flavobacteriaceae bacterium]HIN99704.1 class I SAM-dependent methyltransferase [Flavobacteriaceae bacterium]
MGFLDSYRKRKKVFKDAVQVFRHPFYIETRRLSLEENKKEPSRTEIINFFVETVSAEHYLEIGVRNPDDNFNKINCANKYSVDPGLEFAENPATFKVTSDQFFKELAAGALSLPLSIKFDVIFIDGLHTADQTEKDIQNSINYLTEEGVILLHDCNPPTEFHQRECHGFKHSPAQNYWNGTTWKAFYKFRRQPSLYSACFDTDWGVGILSKRNFPAFNRLEQLENTYFEFDILNKNRSQHLNLLDFNLWKNKL